jgi:acyl carrier protein
MDTDAISASIDTTVRRLVGAAAPETVPLADPGASLLADLGFNSLRLIELAFVIEELFEMDTAAMAEAPPAGTVRDITDFLARKVSAGEATVPSPETVDDVIANL